MSSWLNSILQLSRKLSLMNKINKELQKRSHDFSEAIVSIGVSESMRWKQLRTSTPFWKKSWPRTWILIKTIRDSYLSTRCLRELTFQSKNYLLINCCLEHLLSQDRHIVQEVKLDQCLLTSHQLLQLLAGHLWSHWCSQH